VPLSISVTSSVIHGLFTNYLYKYLPVSFLYLIGYDNIVIHYYSKINFSIYQGHHGDIGAHFSDVISPATTFYERNSLFVDIFGTYKKTHKVVSIFTNAKDDNIIIQALAHFLGIQQFDKEIVRLSLSTFYYLQIFCHRFVNLF
jgi:NADH dehydrogenase/NADH:ubiquinone oxidoreductase subunit G